MRRRPLAAALLGAAFLVLPACGGGGGSSAPTPGAEPQIGDPLPGLSADELAAFQRGRAVFTRRFKPSEGLGPFYNAVSCVSCHSTPVPGGSSRLYRNFYLARYGDPSIVGGQANLPGLPSPVVPAFGKAGFHTSATFSLEGGRTIIPSDLGGEPVQVAQRNGLPLYGVGLFEFVSDLTILSHADPDDANGDGISGRYNTDNGAIGRFGVKAQSNNVELFTRAPFQNQIGITNDPFLGASGIVGKPVAGGTEQVSTDPNDPLIDNDGIPDPEISRQDLGDLIAFTRFLAPPAPIPFDAAALRGQQLFTQVGCTKCHIPELPSSRGPVRAYTDLLLHEMGPALADHMAFGVPQASSISAPTTYLEFRTQPLWGVSMSAPYLHDGRAGTLVDAVTMHGGEAQAARDAFLALGAADQDALIAFLEHL